MSSDDEGYVHRPGAGESPATAGSSGDNSSGGEASNDGFGSRGWILVGVLVVCTIVVPGIIYLSPGVLSAIGIPYIASLLVLPLLPAAVLGITAVWAMTAATHGND